MKLWLECPHLSVQFLKPRKKTHTHTHTHTRVWMHSYKECKLTSCFFFFFFATPRSMWDFSSLTREWACAPLQWKPVVLPTGPPAAFHSLLPVIIWSITPWTSSANSESAAFGPVALYVKPRALPLGLGNFSQQDLITACVTSSGNFWSFLIRLCCRLCFKRSEPAVWTPFPV